MNRQQRTNFSRSKVKTGAPPVQNNIAWTYQSASGVFINLTIEGSESGLVTNGVPAFEILDEGIVAVSSSLAGDTLTVEMNANVPFGSTLALRTPSIALRNRLGGMLNSGFAQIPVPPAPPEAATLELIGWSLDTMQFTIVTGLAPFFCNTSWNFRNLTNSSSELTVLVTASSVTVQMQSALNIDDVIEWDTQDTGFRTANGGGMNGGSIVLT